MGPADFRRVSPAWLLAEEKVAEGVERRRMAERGPLGAGAVPGPPPADPPSAPVQDAHVRARRAVRVGLAGVGYLATTSFFGGWACRSKADPFDYTARRRRGLSR
jgi:hypothetical protein